MATVEIYQKVEEFTITELRPASMNKAIAQAEQERLAEIARIRKEEEERKLREQSFVVLTKIADAINAKAEQGKEHLELAWHTSGKDPFGVSASDWKTVGSRVAEMLKSHGYTVSEPHWYTSSWVSRSGKIGYVYIYWNKS